MTTTADINALLEKCNFTDLQEIRAAVDGKIQEAKDAFMVQAEAMGLACQDENGKKRKRRNSAAKETE